MTQIVTVTLPSEIIYVSGTVNGVSVVWTLVDTTWQTVAVRTANDTYHVALTAIDAAGNTSAISMTLFYGVLPLITDRVGGFYNVSDLNRVGAAVIYLTSQFNALPDVLADYLAGKGVAPSDIFTVPYDPIELTAKTDWVMTDLPTAAAMAVYLHNVTVLRDVLPLQTEAVLPDSMNGLTAEGANNIEKILQAVDAAALALETLKKSYADNTAAVFVYSGEIYGGEII